MSCFRKSVFRRKEQLLPACTIALFLGYLLVLPLVKCRFVGLLKQKRVVFFFPFLLLTGDFKIANFRQKGKAYSIAPLPSVKPRFFNMAELACNHGFLGLYGAHRFIRGALFVLILLLFVGLSCEGSPLH